MTSPFDDEAIEEAARAIRPEWFGDSGKALSNYPDQDLRYQQIATEQAKAALTAAWADLERRGMVQIHHEQVFNMINPNDVKTVQIARVRLPNTEGEG